MITGGSNGIGVELARPFAANGYHLLLAAEQAGHLAEAKQGLNASGAQVETLASDLSTEEADLAKAAFDALQGDKDRAPPKLKNKIMGAIADALPDTAGAAVHRGMSEPGSAKT